MTFYAALDVSLEKTAVCVMGRDGIVREIEVTTCPEALARLSWQNRAGLRDCWPGSWADVLIPVQAAHQNEMMSPTGTE